MAVPFLVGFIKNDKGEVTAVLHHAGVPDSVGKKLKNE
jgi:hypothetical protein